MKTIRTPLANVMDRVGNRAWGNSTGSDGGNMEVVNGIGTWELNEKPGVMAGPMFMEEGC